MAGALDCFLALGNTVGYCFGIVTDAVAVAVFGMGKDFLDGILFGLAAVQKESLFEFVFLA